jgi:arsenate reductase-like glutaredoxin family protein
VLDGVSDLYVAKGKKTLHFDLTSARPTDAELLALLLGRSGKLRAPAIKVSGRLLVGYNDEILNTHLL